jgi:hypothetical protein
MNTFKLVFLLFFIPALSHGAEMTVRDDADWHPATAEQREPLLKDLGEVTLVDFSLRSSGGAGTVLRAHVEDEIGQQTVNESVAALLASMGKKGWSVVEKKPGSVGKLRGVCMIMKREAKGHSSGLVSYLVFTTTDIYTIFVNGPAGMSPDDPLVTAYLSRIEMDSSIEPADIEHYSTPEIARKVVATRHTFTKFVGPVVIIVVGVILVIKRRKQTKPPPLPLA